MKWPVGAAASLVALALGALSGTGPGSPRTTCIKVERFHRDPGWEGFRNRLVAQVCPTTRQDFGFSRTSLAGAAPGEMGGQVWRSTTPAHYADRIAARTLNDRLRASGSFALLKSSGSSGVFFGWFNRDYHGFRPANFLGFRLDGEDWGARVRVEYTTGTWKAGGVSASGLQVRPDGAKHNWSLSYDPAGAGGNGAIEFALDGEPPITGDLLPGHKLDGAKFNRFGMLNVQIPGGPMTVYFDDLEYDGKEKDFASDPRWEGSGNRVAFKDCEQDDSQNFGFSDTNHAGGARGEIGGAFWRTEPDAPHDGYYADRIGPLTLEDSLFASGRIAFTRGCADSGMYLGWFNSAARGDAPSNFVGIVIEGPSRVGHYFRARYGTASGAARDPRTGPVIMPDGRPHRWTFAYDPGGNGGTGAIRATLDGTAVALNLAPDHKAQGAAFDRFGMLTMRRGGHYMTVYFDDVKYSDGRCARPPSVGIVERRSIARRRAAQAATGNG